MAPVGGSSRKPSMPCLLAQKLHNQPDRAQSGAATVKGVESLGVRIAWTIVALIIIGAAVSAVVRVVTAPDRIRERRDIAKEVCLKSGGEWVKAENRHEVCKRA
jgi:hypothetical protein